MTQPMLDEALRRANAFVSRLIQGEVLGATDACVVVAEASAPLSEAAKAVAADAGEGAGLILVPQAVDDVVLLTQTCDLQFTTSDEYRCLVAPVIQVPERMAREALRGRRPGLSALPWHSSTSVADLSRVTSVERSVLVDVVSRGRPRSSVEGHHFAQSVHRYLTRPAFPDHVNVLLAPFVKRIAEKHDRQSSEGWCAHKVSELRLEATPDIEDDEPALNVLVILEAEESPSLPIDVVVDHERIALLVASGPVRASEVVQAASTSLTKREAWTALAEIWIQPSKALVPGASGIGSLEINVLNGEEFSYARSINAPILDLRYLSTRAA